MTFKHLGKFVTILITASLLFRPMVLASENDATQTTAVPQGTEISAKSGILMDSSTGKILFEKNSHEKIPLASVTKIMTLVLVMEQLDAGTISLDDKVTTSTYASKMGGSQIWLKEGEQMTVHELLKATVVASANDAAMALAEHIASSEEEFVQRMNQRAADLGMNDTVFLNPTGLDENGHYSSAFDIAIMTRELLKHEKILEYTKIWMDSLRDGKTELVNTNKLVRFYKGATGMKTGTTNGAGSCISATATRGDMELISVVMGCTTSNERFEDAKRLLDYGFSSFVIYKPTTVIDQTVEVIKGVSPCVKLSASIDKKLLIPAGKQKSIKEEVKLISEVNAPVKLGQKLGEVVITIDGNVINTYDITSKEDIAEMTFGSAFKKLVNRLVEM